MLNYVKYINFILASQSKYFRLYSTLQFLGIELAAQSRWREEVVMSNIVENYLKYRVFAHFSVCQHRNISLNIHKCSTDTHIFLTGFLVSQELRSIVNGSHSDADLQNLVHKFVDIFVLCPVCKYPETKLKISTKNKTIMHVCKACGAKSMVGLSQKILNIDSKPQYLHHTEIKFM